MLPGLLALVLSVPVAEACPPAPGVERVALSVGSQKVLTISPGGTVRVAPPGVVEVSQVKPNQLLLTGAGVGTATLQLDVPERPSRSVSIVVKQYSGCELRIVELAKAFPCGSTLEVKMIGDRLYLDGEASSVEEWRVLFEVLKRYPGVILLGHLKPQVIEQEFRAADAALQAAGLARAHWTRAGDSVLLEGEVPEDQQPALRAVDEAWRPRLELVLRRASVPRDGG